MSRTIDNKRTMPKITFTQHVLFCLMLLAARTVVPLPAQNNPYKIADSLYPLYQRANHLYTRSEGLDTDYTTSARFLPILPADAEQQDTPHTEQDINH